MPFQSLSKTDCGSYDVILSIRRENREFARKQALKHREILAQVEAELNFPKGLSRYARKAQDEE